MHLLLAGDAAPLKAKAMELIFALVAGTAAIAVGYLIIWWSLWRIILWLKG